MRFGLPGPALSMRLRFGRDADVAGESHLEVVYARDPEGNLVELQLWS